MIRLVALDQDNAQTTLDLEGAPAISLNLAVAKPGETMQRHAPYSQSFRLPFTDRNNIFFAHFYEVTLSDGDFDPTQKTEVLIYEDGVQVIRGSMQLRAVRLMSQVYEVNVLGDVADLFAEMGSKLLRAAFLDGDDYATDYNFDLTDANVVTSQTLTNDITEGAVGAGTVIIPLADHGLQPNSQPLAAQAGFGLLDDDLTPTGLTAFQLKPALQLKALVKLIIESNGFNYVSNFFDSAFFESIYMTLATEVETLPTVSSSLFRAERTSTQVLTNNVTTVLFDDDSTPPDTFDDDNAYDPGTGVYLCPSNGNYTFTVTVTIQNPGLVDGLVIVRLIAGSTSLAGQAIEVGSGTQQTFSFSGSGFVLASTAVEVQVSNPVATLNVLGGFFACTANEIGRVLVPHCMPRIKQRDFMRDLSQRFNLVIEADADNPQRLYIEPYSEWIADGTDAYWTDKLDLDKERTLMPTSSLKSARILFGDKESPDVGNAYFKGAEGQTFGTYDQDIDDDFATGELKNAPVFAPYFVYPVPTLQGDPNTVLPSVLIHRSYERDGTGVKPASQPPKLFFATGLQAANATLYIGTTALTSYQFCSPLSESPLDSDTQSLYWNSTSLPFSINNPIMAGSEVPAIGLHRSYWSSYLADIYSADSRVFEAHLYLTPSDVRNVRFNDRYHILGATYKLTEIVNYQIGTGESTLCKFLRDLGRASFGACDAIPTQSNANGTVTFTNPDGTTTTDPGQQCCEAFGYIYDGEAKVCRWQPIIIVDPGPVTPPVAPGGVQDPVPNTNGDNPGPVSPVGTTTTTTTEDGAVTVYDEVILTGQTTGGTTVDTSAPGGVPISVRANVIAFGVIRAMSVTVGGTGEPSGTAKFETFRFLADGTNETVSVVATSGTTLTSGSPNTRRVTGVMSNGELTFRVLGDTDEVIEFTLAVEMTRMYNTSISEFENAILTEAGARLAGVNGRVLLQE